MALLLLALSLVPRPLACLERYYAVAAKCDERGCRAVLPDGSEIPYDDGKKKSLEERLAHPDVEDLFAQRYPTGAIKPVTTVDQDPGRVRLDAVLRLTYPKTGLTQVEFFGRKLTVHKKAAAAFSRVAARLAKLPEVKPFVQGLGGTYVPRKIAGTDRPSAHSWGISIDLNPSLTHYWRWEKGGWKNTVPQSIVDAFEAEGFIWGGRWYHFDTMHFEYRPELLDAACYP
jgi:D-alanyl-D-alanine carboxypeptidase